MSMPVVRILQDKRGSVCGITVDGHEIQATSVHLDHYPDRLTKVSIEIETTDFNYVEKEAQAVIE